MKNNNSPFFFYHKVIAFNTGLQDTDTNEDFYGGLPSPDTLSFKEAMTFIREMESRVKQPNKRFKVTDPSYTDIQLLALSEQYDVLSEYDHRFLAFLAKERATSKAGEAALELLTKVFLRTIISIFKKAKVKNGKLFSELIHEGCIGLIKAVDEYDPWGKGSVNKAERSFIGKALLMIRNEMTHYDPYYAGMFFKAGYRASRNMLKAKNHAAFKRAHPKLEHIPLPKYEDKHEEYDTYYRRTSNVFSINAVNDAILCMFGAIDNEHPNNNDALLLKLDIQRAIDTPDLSDRHRYMIDKEFGLSEGKGRSGADIGRTINISKMRISQEKEYIERFFHNDPIVQSLKVYLGEAS